MRTHRLALALIVALALAAACAPKTITTTPGKAAWYADQVSKRVNELQGLGIQLEAGGTIQTADARIVVTFAVAANKVLRDAPAGWPQTIKTAWLQAKAHLPPAFLSAPAAQIAVAVLETLLDSLIQPAPVAWRLEVAHARG